MYTDNFEQLFKGEKLKKVTQQNIDLIEENLARVSSQFKRLANVKSVEELVELQKECFTENISAGAENLQRLFKIGIEAQEELVKKGSAAVSKAADKVSEKMHK